MRGVLMVIVLAGCEQAHSTEAAQPPAPVVKPAARPVSRVKWPLDSCKVGKGVVLTPHMPTAAEVVAMLSPNYREPERLQVEMQRIHSEVDRPDILRWSPSYDGVPVIAEARSVEVEGGWCTRFYRQLSEPERVRRGDLISSDVALAKAGLAKAKVELLHLAIYKNIQKPGTAGNNTDDFDNVLERFELLYIVSTSDEEVHVDPYSGAIHKRIDRSGDCMEHSYR
jgi:hypothetical protein